MPDKKEFEQKFWKSIRSDMTAMIGIDGVRARPMTAQFDGDNREIYFFTSRDTELPENLKRAKKATLTYASKGHDLFATVHFGVGVDLRVFIHDRRRVRAADVLRVERVFTATGAAAPEQRAHTQREGANADGRTDHSRTSRPLWATTVRWRSRLPARGRENQHDSRAYLHATASSRS